MTNAIGNKGMTAVSQVSITHHVSTNTKPSLTYVLFTLPQSKDIYPSCLLLFVKIHRTVRDEIESSPTYLLTTSCEYLSFRFQAGKSKGGGGGYAVILRVSGYPGTRDLRPAGYPGRASLNPSIPGRVPDPEF